VGRPDFKSGKEPLAGPWWVRLPLSSAKAFFAGDRPPSKLSVIAGVVSLSPSVILRRRSLECVDKT
jgi:hypothetical protein